MAANSEDIIAYENIGKVAESDLTECIKRILSLKLPIYVIAEHPFIFLKDPKYEHLRDHILDEYDLIARGEICILLRHSMYTHEVLYANTKTSQIHILCQNKVTHAHFTLVGFYFNPNLKHEPFVLLRRAFKEKVNHSLPYVALGDSNVPSQYDRETGQLVARISANTNSAGFFHLRVSFFLLCIIM